MTESRINTGSHAVSSAHRPRSAHLMVKPSGWRCNLRCGYCFYLEKSALFHESVRGMTDEILETFVRKYIQWQEMPEIEFAWQGGEPTTMGLDFFRKAVELQRKYGAGRLIRNSIQTNGTMLDEEWCEFLAAESFLVGLSIDGPEDVHDRYRKYPDGRGSFRETERAVRLLKRFGVEFNALACVTRESAYEGAKVYKFLRNRGISFIQFIPIVERMPDRRANELSLNLSSPPDVNRPDNESRVMPFTVEPEQYGRFLCDVFDEWKRRDIGKVFVNQFDVALAAWLGMNPPLCVHSRFCGTALAIEHDGSIYACDHFVYPEYKRGNIMKDDLDSIVFDPRQIEFGESKWTALPGMCRECRFLGACHGGCPKHRFRVSPTGDPGLNYLCEGYRAFFSHVEEDMKRMAQLIRSGREAAELMKAYEPDGKRKPRKNRLTTT